jgi:two-component system, NarL family, nitrate/nitrite response regulator NarL
MRTTVERLAPATALRSTHGTEAGPVMRTTVLIVCEVRLYRDGLRRSLGQRPATEVVGTAAGADEALAQVELLCPEVVLLDMGMAGATELIGDLLARAPLVKVVALGVAEEPHAVLECVEAGAAGYVASDASLDDLNAALEAAARGAVLCSPEIAGSLVRRVAALAGERSPHTEVANLTQREREILGLIEEGMSNKEIARRLRVKLATVKNHVHHILEKLGVRGRGAAAALARGSLRPDTAAGARPDRPNRA